MQSTLGACLIFSLYLFNAMGLQCMDENNKSVDWYLLYKLPRNSKSKNPLIQQGIAYTYITSYNETKEWTLSYKSVNDTTSIPGQTLKRFYQNKTLTQLLYNDQPPNSTASSTSGHSKGVLITDTKSGFWIVHSVPHYPPKVENGYSFPESGTHFGQSFLCISLPYIEINTISNQLLYMHPQIYSSQNTLNITNISRLIKGEFVKTAPYFSEGTIQSFRGIKFRSFAKTGLFGKDLYEDWVAPTLQNNLLVETWPNGPGRLPSDCKLKFKVNNVLKIKIAVANLTFSATSDHSKWAVGTDDPWVCIGGINRAERQKHRGGGTVCFTSSPIWNTYKNSIADVEPCETLKTIKG